MIETTVETKISRLKIDNTDIFLENFDKGQGKITVSDTYGHNYSMYWGSMGDTLEEFICKINSSYFSDKLLGHRSMTVFDTKSTFKNIRKFITSEMNLPYYKHMEFQKDMRKILKQFQKDCEEFGSDQYFVDHFYRDFIDRLDYSLIKDRFEQEFIEKDFKSISECWDFIGHKESEEYKWLSKLHSKLKKELLKLK